MMATRVKLSRKQLIKEPDQFLSTTDRILHFCRENKNPVIAAAAGLAVILASVGGFRYAQQAQTAKMETLLVEMEKIRNQDKGKNPEGIIASLSEKLEKFSDGRQKQRARILLADSYFEARQLDKAIRLYSEVVEKSKAGELNHDLAQLGLAYSNETSKNYKKAIEIFKSILEQNTSLPSYPVYLDLVRCYELDGDSKNALLTLRDMRNKFQGEAELDKVNKRIDKLEGRV